MRDQDFGTLSSALPFKFLFEQRAKVRKYHPIEHWHVVALSAPWQGSDPACLVDVADTGLGFTDDRHPRVK